MRSRCLVAALTLALGLPLAGADTVRLTPAKDNTLYESASGSLSNGSGSRIFAGRSGGGVAHRAVLAFDVAGNVPAGATIDSVTLTLTLVQTGTGPQPVTLHRLEADWGEGASVAPGGQGGGTAAAFGDATWIHTFFDTEFWGQPGGDFSPLESASAEIDALGVWAVGPTLELADDVQAWLDDPASNFGWVLVGNEAEPSTAKAFASRDDANPAQWPVLQIDYTPAPADDGDDDGEADDEDDAESDLEADGETDDDPGAPPAGGAQAGQPTPSGLLPLGLAAPDSDRPVRPSPKTRRSAERQRRR